MSIPFTEAPILTLVHVAIWKFEKHDPITTVSFPVECSHHSEAPWMYLFLTRETDFYLARWYFTSFNFPMRSLDKNGHYDPCVYLIVKCHEMQDSYSGSQKQIRLMDIFVSDFPSVTLHFKRYISFRFTLLTLLEGSIFRLF